MDQKETKRFDKLYQRHLQMANRVDHYACARQSHRYAPKKHRFSKNRISCLFPKKIFPL